MKIRTRRRGFTLIELLVVIAIIAVLIALLVAGGASGPRGGPAHPVHQQSQADWPGDAQLPHGQQHLPSRHLGLLQLGQFRQRWQPLHQLERLECSDLDAALSGADPDLQRGQFLLRPDHRSAGRFNSTVFFTKINSFLCPSDGNAGTGGTGGSTPCINSYYASEGTSDYSSGGTPGTGVVTLQQCTGGTGSTGVFYYATSYGIQNITDGTSNTVAFSESLAGTNGNTPVNYSSGVNTTTGYQGYDVWQSITTIPATAPGAQMAATLSGCNASWQTATAGAGLSTNKGQYWAWGAETMSMFNTIVPPNSRNSSGERAGSDATPAACNRPITRTSPTPTATTPAVAT